MRELQISANKEKEFISKNLVLNISIFILIFINSVLAYTTFKDLSNLFKDHEAELLKEISKSRIKVEVLNGCGVSQVAETLTEFLRSNKVDVVNFENYRSFDIVNSIIICRNDKIKNAERIAALVGLDDSSIIQQVNPDYLLDITFILGKDYRNLIPLTKR